MGTSNFSGNPTVTVVLPFRELPEWLMLSAEMWMKQDIPVRLLLVQTAREPSFETRSLMKYLRRFPHVELADLRMRETEHSHDVVMHALDYAFARCPTDFIITAHTDLFLKHRGVARKLRDLCNEEKPVVGWEMSPRYYLRQPFKGADGLMGHCCTIFHIPTMDRLGISWSLRRAARVFGIPRRLDDDYIGWPDTEVGVSLLLKEKGVKFHFLGREYNFFSQETNDWIHSRARTSNPDLRARHGQDFRRAVGILKEWRALPEYQNTPELFSPESIDTCLPEENLGFAHCVYRSHPSGEAICGLINADLAEFEAEAGHVNESDCRKCEVHATPTPERLNLGLSIEAFNRANRICLKKMPIETAAKVRKIRNRFLVRAIDLMKTRFRPFSDFRSDLT